MNPNSEVVGALADAETACKVQARPHSVKGFRTWVCRAFLTFTLLNVWSSVGAQPVLDALSTSGHRTPGFVTGGLGWTFVPTTDIRVTAILDAGPDPGPQTLQFWDSTNAVISSFTTSYGAGFLYQSISPLVLTAGHRYGVSLIGGTVDFYANLRPDFEVSPYLAGFHNYIFGGTTAWTPSSPNNTNVLYFGPTFQFQIVPWLKIALRPQGQLEVTWPSDAVGYHLEYAEHLPAALWLLVTNAVQTVQSNYMVVDSVSGNRFYRLSRP